MNISASLLARLLLGYHDRRVLHKGFEGMECFTEQELAFFRTELHDLAELMCNRAIYHLQILPQNHIRRNNNLDPDGDLYVLWAAKDWEVDVRKREEDQKKMDTRVKEHNINDETIQKLARAMASQMMLDIKTCLPMALSVVKSKNTVLALEVYGVDISHLLI